MTQEKVGKFLHKNKMNRQKLAARIVACSLFGMILDTVACFAFYSHISNLKWPEERAQAAMILYGAFSVRDELNAETMRRINYSVSLYRKGRFDHFICCGGARLARDVYGSEIMQRKLIELGVPQESVSIERQSNDTISNLKEGIRIMKAHDLQSAVVIGSPLQMSRNQAVMTDLNGDSLILPRPYSVDSANPRIRLHEIWCQVHYDWIARVCRAVLPDSVYRSLVNALRS